MKSSQLGVLACVLAGVSLQAQQTKTGNPTVSGGVEVSGTCNNVFIGSGGTFKIECTQAGITRAEAKRQADRLVSILNQLRRSSANFTEVNTKLDAIIDQLNSLTAASQPRHLDEVLEAKLHSAIFPFWRYPILVGYAMGSREALNFANEFCKALTDANYLSCPDGGPHFGIGTESQPLDSISLHFSTKSYTELLARHAVLPQCRALARFISEEITHGPVPSYSDLDYRLPLGKNNDQVCLLLIGEK